MDVEKKNLYVNNCYVKKPTLFTMLAPHCNTMRRPPTHALGVVVSVSRPKRCKHVVANGGSMGSPTMYNGVKVRRAVKPIIDMRSPSNRITVTPRALCARGVMSINFMKYRQMVRQCFLIS